MEESMDRIMTDLKESCELTVEHLTKEASRLRTGRASSSLIEGVNVEYYGSQVPIQQLGLINVPEARMITVQVYDSSAVESVEKAIQQADLGLNPQRDGSLIRLSIPPLTEERRKEFVKKLYRLGEDAKVALRGHRRDSLDAIKKAEKDKEIAPDEGKRAGDEIQKVIDSFVKKIDTVLAQKEQEILEV
jgi:ribosome recycling factor